MKSKIISIVLFSTVVAFKCFAFDFSNQNFFATADVFLKKYVYSGLVDYKTIVSHRNELDKLINISESMNIQSLSDNEKKAFWINAYNITVIKSVINHWPIKGPLEVEGFFDKEKHIIAGQSLTLNEIENNKLRNVYKDSRIHFVLVCGAKGCPPIVPFAYMPEKLEAQLNQQTKIALNNPSFIQTKAIEKKVLLSEIFKWYKDDFPEDIIAYINQFRDEKISKDYIVDYYSYDWNLNSK